MIGLRKALASFLPPVCGAVAFLALGVPAAHAAPLWVVEGLPDVFSILDPVASCVESFDLGWVFDTPGPSGAVACGKLSGLAFALLGLVAIVVIAIGRMRMTTEHKRLDVARRLVEQGIDPPPALLMGPARNDMRRGVVLMFAGIGLFVAGAFHGDRGLMACGLVPEFIGIGYLLSYWLAARSEDEGGGL
jgi:hypothetical protein